MPQRFLRPGITTSRRFNSLDWQAQSFFVRLLTIVDDYGRHEADPTLLASLCFPLNRDITMQTVDNICSQLLAAGLATFYAGPDEKRYLQLSRWKEVPRSQSRCPAPPDNTCNHLLPTANKCSSPSPSPSPSPSSSPSSSPEKEEGASQVVNGRASSDDSRTQWAALNARVKEADATRMRGELDETGQSVLKKMRGALSAIQKKQARGDFTPLDLAQFDL